MKDLDKELISLVFKPMPETINENHLYVATQIKTTILEALKADMRKEIRGFDPLAYRSYKSGYNQAIDDCLEVCNKLLGDSK